MLYEVCSLPTEKLDELYIQESYKLAAAAVVDHNTVQAIKTDLASIITELAGRGLMDLRTN
jgi:hypothetical protein